MEIAHRLHGGAVGRRAFALPASRAALSGLAARLAVAGVCACLTGVAIAIGHFTAFYSVDGDVKYLAALNIAHHFQSPAITYPWHRFDPAGQFTLPLTAWYQGHDYAGYSLPFLYLSGLFVFLLGAAGLVVPSVVGTAVLLYAQLALARLVGLTTNRILLLVVTAAATPLLFYSVSFWEHTWGVGLLLAGIAALLYAVSDSSRRASPTVLSGALFLGAVLMRRDTVIPAVICLCLAPIFFRRRDVAVKCAISGAILTLSVIAIIGFNPQPLAVGLTHASPGRGGIGVRHGLSRMDKIKFLLTGGWATGLLAFWSALALTVRRFQRRLLVPVVAAGSLVVAAALAFSMLSAYTFSDENVLAFCPLALWGFLAPIFLWRNADAADDVGKRSPLGARFLKPFLHGVADPALAALYLLWTLTILGCVAVVATAFDSGGAQWGPRYLLFAYPLLILLALKGREQMLQASGMRTRVVNYSFVGILAMSFLLQGLGLFALTVKQNLAAKADTAIAATHTSLVVSAFPVIDLLAPRYESGTYLYAPTEQKLKQLMNRLRAQGHHRLVMLCDPVDPCQWNGYTGWSHGPIRHVKHIVRFAVYHSA